MGKAEKEDKGRGGQGFKAFFYVLEGRGRAGGALDTEGGLEIGGWVMGNDWLITLGRREGTGKRWLLYVCMYVVGISWSLGARSDANRKKASHERMTDSATVCVT